MRRRGFMAMLGGAAMAWPFAAHGQQSQPLKRVGIFNPRDNPTLPSFFETLNKLGWVEGRTVAFDYEWIDDLSLDLSPLAEALVTRRPDVILAPGLGIWAARDATHSIPIVFAQISDPVERGLVTSLAKPGGNVTGFADNGTALGGKWVELLKEVSPTLARIATLYDPDVAPHAPPYLRAIDAAARSFGITAMAAPVRTEDEVEAAISKLGGENHGGVAVIPDAFTIRHRRIIIAEALSYRVPAIYPYHLFTEDGGLMDYASDLDQQYRGAAGYVDRILRGANPADLPVQQPTTYRFTINLPTAKALGLSIPPTLLATVNDVIE